MQLLWADSYLASNCHKIEGLIMAMQSNESNHVNKAAFPDAIITIEDLRDGDHYACHVISSAFTGKNRVQQHQMVYKALGGRMGGELHALALQTSPPK